MELTIEQLIKIILGLVVVAVVIGALYFFGNNVTDFFNNLPGANNSKFILSVLK